MQVFEDFLKDSAFISVFIGEPASLSKPARSTINRKAKVKTMARVNIPRNPDDLIALAKSIGAKHAADAAASPLAALNMADLGAKAATADTQNLASAKAYRDGELATQNRDLALGADKTTQGTVNYYVSSVRDVLLGLYKGNEQKLGEWGFMVDQSAQAGAKPAPAAAKTP